jgi:hypothetical protein
MANNYGEAKMEAIYAVVDIDDCAAFLRVVSMGALEVANQLENYGVITQYQRHWEIADRLTDDEKRLIDRNTEILTDGIAAKLKADFIAAGGNYVEGGVALYDHESPNPEDSHKFETFSEQLAEYMFCDYCYSVESYGVDSEDGED